MSKVYGAYLQLEEEIQSCSLSNIDELMAEYELAIDEFIDLDTAKAQDTFNEKEELKNETE